MTDLDKLASALTLATVSSNWTEHSKTMTLDTALYLQLHRDVSALIAEHRAALARVGVLEEALGWFLTDERFVVSVGGNPNVVDRMLSQARAALEPKP